MKRILIVIIALLLWASPAFAISLSHVTSAGVASGSTLNVSVTIGSNHLIVIGGNIRTAATGDTISFSDAAGDTFTSIGAGTGNVTRGYIAWAKTTGLTAQNITITTSGTYTVAEVSVEDVTGFNTTTPNDSGTNNTSFQSGTTAPSITTLATAAASGELVYSSFTYGNFTYTEETSPLSWTSTAINIGTSNGKSSMGYFINSGTGTITRTGALSGGSNTFGAIAAFEPAATTASCTRTLLGVGC